MSGNKLKIAMIGVPASPVTSGLAYSSRNPLYQKLSESYNVISFVPRIRNIAKLSSTRSIIMSGDYVKWLFSLPFHLIKSNADLFMAELSDLSNIIAFVVSKMLRKPLITFDEHWYWQKTLPMRLLWPIARLIARHSYLIVPGTRAMKFWTLSGVPSKRMKIVHFDTSVLEIEARHVSAAKRLRESLKAEKVILYFGRLIKRKGADYLIRAFAKLAREYDDVVLIIAGEGDEKRTFKNLCRTLNVENRVRFTNFVKEEDKATYFIACDVFVCPSITLGMPEIWGIVVSEAMSVGKPVIVTTAVGCSSDLVRPGVNGYIIPERDVDALYKALKTLLADENLRVRMGKASKEIIQKQFTYPHVLGELQESIKIFLRRHYENRWR
jgi:glycosyltransferase involved in cell wall biosynthesis